MTTYTYPVSGPIAVSAKIRGSDLEVTAADTDEAVVTIEGSKDNTATREYIDSINVEMRGTELIIELPKVAGVAGFNWFGSTTHVLITLLVPTGSDLDVSSGSGDVDGRGDLGDVNVRSGSGDLTLEGAKAVRNASGSGDVSVRDLIEGDFTSGSGDVSVGTARGTVRNKSGSGDLTIDSAQDVVCSGASGDISIRHLAGEATLRAASGDLIIGEAISGKISASSASGDIRIGVRVGTAVLLDCSSASGDTRTDLSGTDAPSEGNLRLEVRARSASGDISVVRA